MRQAGNDLDAVAPVGDVERGSHHVRDLDQVEWRRKTGKNVRLERCDQIRVRGRGRQDDDAHAGARIGQLLRQREVFVDRRRWIGDDHVD